MLEGEEPTRILLASQDPAVRRRLRSALTEYDAVVVAEARTGQEALAMTAYFEPEVAVLEHSPPRMDALAAIREAVAAGCVTRLMLLTTGDDDEVALAALRAGAVGHVAADLPPAGLARAVAGACAGEAVVSRRVATLLVERFRTSARAGAGLRPVRSQLTDREWEVLDLLALGATTDEIARTLVLSTETVRSHLKNLYRKLGVRSREEATAAAARLRDLDELPRVPAG